MRGFLATAVSLLAIGVSAFPTAELEKRGSCISASDASALVTAFQDLISLPFNTTLAKAALEPDFTDNSDSVSELINKGCPTGPATLGKPTFTSRAAFIKSQSTQSPITFNVLNTWVGCTFVVIRWTSPDPGTISGTQEEVTGIIVLVVEPNPKPGAEFAWKIEHVYSEFNSGAWLYDLGIFKPTNCTS